MGAVELRLVLDAERGEVVGKKCAVAFFFVGVVEAGEAVAELVEAAVVDAAVELFQHEFGARNQADLQVVKLRQARGGGAVEILRDRPCVVKADVVGGVTLGQVAGVVGGFGVEGDVVVVHFQAALGCGYRIVNKNRQPEKRDFRLPLGVFVSGCLAGVHGDSLKSLASGHHSPKSEISATAFIS